MAEAEAADTHFKAAQSEARASHNDGVRSRIRVRAAKKIYISITLGVEQAALHEMYSIPIIIKASIQYHFTTSYLPPLDFTQKKYAFNGIKTKKLSLTATTTKCEIS